MHIQHLRTDNLTILSLAIHEHEISPYYLVDFFHQSFVVFLYISYILSVKCIPKFFILGVVHVNGIVFLNFKSHLSIAGIWEKD